MPDQTETPALAGTYVLKCGRWDDGEGRKYSRGDRVELSRLKAERMMAAGTVVRADDPEARRLSATDEELALVRAEELEEEARQLRAEAAGEDSGD
jgi:hypothetical protein